MQILVATLHESVLQVFRAVLHCVHAIANASFGKEIPASKIPPPINDLVAFLTKSRLVPSPEESKSCLSSGLFLDVIIVPLSFKC
jgi:hypothetical protein